MDKERRKLTMHTPAREAEDILAEHVRKEVEEVLASGHPVRRGDQFGVYDLYPDGRKVYVKKYDRG